MRKCDIRFWKIWSKLSILHVSFENNPNLVKLSKFSQNRWLAIASAVNSSYVTMVSCLRSLELLKAFNILSMHPAETRRKKKKNMSKIFCENTSKFNKVASDQVIKQTVNKEQKGSIEKVGVSALERTVQRWIVSSHIIVISWLKMFCNRRLCCSRNVLPSKINLDERRVAKCYELMNFWGNPIKKRTYWKAYPVPLVLAWSLPLTYCQLKMSQRNNLKCLLQNK